MSLADPPTIYRQNTYAHDDLAGMIRGVEDDGFALIPGVLSQDEVRQCREAIDQLRPIHWDQLGGANDHFKNVFNQNPFWLRFIDRSPVIELAEATLTSECHIIGQTAWRSHPGHNGDWLHTDQIFLTIPEELLLAGQVKLPCYICTAHYYLSDITEELCPTKVIPGSHKSGRSPGKNETSWNGRELQSVLCKAGDVLYFRSELWHSGSQNRTTDQTRYLLQVHYGGRNVAQHFSPFLDWRFNPEVLRIANPRQRRLLGDHKRMAYD